MRSPTKKHELNGELVIERKSLGIHDILKLNRKSCVGCSICTKTCPQEAISLSKGIVQNGRLFEKGIIDIDVEKCTLCGGCVVLCPLNAIEMLRNGSIAIPIVDAGVFPILLKSIVVNISNCTPSCMLACKENCPTDAITVTVEKGDAGEIKKILKVNIDEKKCVFCKKCELVCPQTAIHVTKPFQGSIHINTELCKENCQACVDICPSKALALGKDGAIKIEKQHCIFCGACQEICPEKAIEVKRSKVLYKPVMSGAWITALEKLTSEEQLTKELNASFVKKRIELAKKL